ncbi:MAG: penicillin-binding protein 1B [Gammaproteobacteria bacterium]
MIPYNSIREVLDSDGSALQRYPLEIDQVLQPGPVFLSNFLMTQVVSQGTGKSLSKMMTKMVPLAGKTGTTNDLRDSWFAGFGDELLGIVWIGRDDNKPTQLTGASGAMHVWAKMMNDLNIKGLKLVPPEEIDWLPASGQSCPEPISIPYIRGYRPAHFYCK